jgi:exodeoxyribonuclease V gamma subunit
MPIRVLPHPHFVSLLDGLGNPSRKDLPLRVPVVIPSLAFSDFLQQRLALRFGVCTGLHILMPRDFIHSVVGPGPNSPWSRDKLCWYLMEMIDDTLPELGISTAVDQRERFALANLLADRLDQYGHFRPHWIRAWNQHKNATSLNELEQWQRQLWCKLRDRIEVPHPVLEFSRRYQDADFLTVLKSRFPRVIILVSGNLDPLLVDVLQLLDQADVAVELHAILPSMGFLDALKRFTSPDSLSLSPEDVEVPSGHPLLQSMGRNAVGSFVLLGQLDEHYSEWSDVSYAEINSDLHQLSTLNQLQADLRNLCTPSFLKQGCDHSISFHACFGIRRELESVREEIIRCFAEIADLQPADIHIAAPRLESYAPLVNAIFAHGEQSLPVRLTNLPAFHENSVAWGLVHLLKTVVEGDFPISAVLELLYLPTVLEKIHCENADLPRRLLKNSGYTHGLGNAAAGRLGFAIDRLIAGTWMEPDSTEKYPQDDYILPIGDELGSELVWRRHFNEWLSELATLFQFWQEAASARDWAERLQQAANTILSQNPDNLLCLQPHLDNLRKVPFVDLIDCGTLLDWLMNRTETHGKRHHTAGKIAFGSLQHMQNLPCRVLILVGMNAQFPTQNRHPSWDLMRHEPMIWDRNPRIDHRQLFLDALLTPSDRLIVTAANRNQRSGLTEPFSTCVEELQRTLNAMNAPCRVIEHRLQPYSTSYFQADSPLPQSFSKQQSQLSRCLFQQDKPAPRPFCEVSDTPIEESPHALDAWQFGPTITLSELCRFWQNPARAYTQTLQLKLYTDDTVVDTDLDFSPIDFGKLMHWQLNQTLLQRALFDTSPSDYLRAAMIANRQLPPAQLGLQDWQSNEAQVADFYLRLQPYLGDTLTVQYTLPSGILLHETLMRTHDQQNYLIYGQFNFSKIKYQLRMLLPLLLISVSEHPLPLRVHNLNEPEPFLYHPFAADEALSVLIQLLSGYSEGQRQPLPYAPETSAEIFKNKQRPIDTTVLKPSFPKSWYSEGPNQSPGEGKTPEAELAWRNRDPFAAETMPQWVFWADCVMQALQKMEPAKPS